MMSKTNH